MVVRKSLWALLVASTAPDEAFERWLMVEHCRLHSSARTVEVVLGRGTGGAAGVAAVGAIDTRRSLRVLLKDALARMLGY